MTMHHDTDPLDSDTACAHDWQPIEGWYARYRCTTCRVVGYKPCAVHPRHANDPRITPYRCEAKCKGERCSQPAVHSLRGKKFRCAAHHGAKRTGEARKAMQVREVAPALSQAPAAAPEVTAVSLALPCPSDALTSKEDR